MLILTSIFEHVYIDNNHNFCTKDHHFDTRVNVGEFRGKLNYICTCSGSPGQECCYNAEDNLVVGSQSGGSVNRFAPVDFDSFYQHIQHDIIPYVHCCPRACREYYIRRPSDDGTRYRPLPPGDYAVTYQAFSIMHILLALEV